MIVNYSFFFTILDNLLFGHEVLSIEDDLNITLTGDILNLTATEIIALCKTSRFFTTKGW